MKNGKNDNVGKLEKWNIENGKMEKVGKVGKVENVGKNEKPYDFLE